jgi:hypothetical protein
VLGRRGAMPMEKGTALEAFSVPPLRCTSTICLAIDCELRLGSEKERDMHIRGYEMRRYLIDFGVALVENNKKQIKSTGER